MKKTTHAVLQNVVFKSGWAGIRTQGTRERTVIFKTTAFDHSATHPYIVKKQPPNLTVFFICIVLIVLLSAQMR